MENFRKIDRHHVAPKIQMGPTTLRQAIPVNGLEQVSPFILLHHFDFTKNAGEHDFNVPPHPHRGFSPITFIYEGSIRHTDSLGNDEEIGDGEVQWINAGHGIIHSERAGTTLNRTGGRMQGIQLWINTPRKHKLDPPVYQPIRKEQIPVIKNGSSEIQLVSGTYGGKTGPADSEIVTAMIRMQESSDLVLNLPSDENSALYVLEGHININDTQALPQHGFVSFSPGEGAIKISTFAQSKLLLMSGKPINEPLVTHGPFVMTSETEIMEAMRDYRDNKMGFLY